MEMAGSVAVVTGAARGIGRAIAVRLAQAGAKVVLADIRDADNAITAKQISEARGLAMPIRCDITQAADVADLLRKANENFGAVNILVNNAGGTPGQRAFVDTDEEYWNYVIHLNLYGALRVTHAVIPEMIRRRAGNIINIASGGALIPNPQRLVYGACKAAIMSMTRTLAAELSPHDVRVNCVSPGVIDTPLVAEETTPEIRRALVERTLMRRMGQPEEIAAAVMFLLSDEASYILGQTLQVNGGGIMT